MSSEIVGRIAAGEVVERPASVLKELVENSIDAHATQIRINIEQGGHKLVQVIDNGCGMDRSDALLCLETHATSKICEDGDVGHIATLGFRGEALPSIASVSRFNLQTRRAEDPVGTELVVDFGAIREQRDCGCAVGTNIRVGQLFGNMPARKKFLRGAETEDGYIEEMVRSLALSRPDVNILLFLNGRETIRANATSDLGMRVASVLGKETFEAMLPLDYAEGNIRVRGFVSKPGFSRSNRREQRIIVNGRSASADTIFFAIRDAYESLVMKGRYPGAVIYIDLPPECVDVNVHPTKREVRFRDGREVGQVLSAAIRLALRKVPGLLDMGYVQQDTSAVKAIPQTPPLRNAELPFEGQPSHGINNIVPPHSSATVPVTNLPVRNVPSNETGGGVLQRVPPPFDVGLSLNLPPHSSAISPELVNPPLQRNLPIPEVEKRVTATRSNLKNLRYIGKLGSRYALAESEDGLVVVNLRAAHQRILFERLLAGMNKQSIPQQQLLIPSNLALGPDDARFLRNELQHFQKIGFSIEPFGGNSFIVTAVPASFTSQDVVTVIRDIIDDLRRSSVTNRQNTIHLAQTACRHAISASTVLDDKDIISIMHDLGSCDMPYTCPNGHPTMIHITNAELEKRFQA